MKNFLTLLSMMTLSVFSAQAEENNYDFILLNATVVDVADYHFNSNTTYKCIVYNTDEYKNQKICISPRMRHESIHIKKGDVFDIKAVKPFSASMEKVALSEGLDIHGFSFTLIDPFE